MDKTELLKLKYAAPYDHEAALTLAYEYMNGRYAQRDKYLAFVYYEMFRALEMHNPKPLSESAQEALQDKKTKVEVQLKESLYLDENMRATKRTKVRSILSTGTYRESVSWLNLIRNTISHINDFLMKVNLTVLGNVFNKVPYLSTMISASEIIYELGIVTKNSSKKAWNDYREGKRVSKREIGKEAVLSLRKDHRLSRLTLTTFWLTISVVSLAITTVAAPLLVIGIAADLAATLISGLLNINKQNKELDFIAKETKQCNESLEKYANNGANYSQIANLMNQTEASAANNEDNLSPEMEKFLQVKKSRLNMRQQQIKASKKYQFSKISSNLAITGVMLFGASLTVIPTPITQLAGLATMAVAGVGFVGLKLIEKFADSNPQTQLAITKEETLPNPNAAEVSHAPQASVENQADLEVANEAAPIAGVPAQVGNSNLSRMSFLASGNNHLAVSDSESDLSEANELSEENDLGEANGHSEAAAEDSPEVEQNRSTVSYPRN